MQVSTSKSSSSTPFVAQINVLGALNKMEESVAGAFEDSNFNFSTTSTLQELSRSIEKFSIADLTTTILIEVDQDNFEEVTKLYKSIKSNWYTRGLIFIFVLTEDNPKIMQAALKMRVNDCYAPPIPLDDLKERIRFLTTYMTLKSQVDQLPQTPAVEYKTPLGKRLLDIVSSSLAILFLSPIFLIVAILIRLESKGSIFYVSKRVGTGYKIFDFYKFRSMIPGADKEVANLTKLNQYGDTNSAFFKVLNDPRITKLGSILRKTSLDELPQLFNVLRGDMSLVGNRPLPLYEAEQLTTNEWSMRFLGPAGLTGLWQISKRGKQDMSETERKELDNYYASNYSVLLDLKIILKTIPALIQKENA